MRCRYVLLPLLALACMTAAGAASFLEGAWGTPGTRLTLSAERGLIEEGCAEIALPPVTLTADGRFTVTGRMTAYAGGPQDADAPPREIPVIVAGRLDGAVMELAIDQRGAERRTLTLRHGFRSKIIRCV